MSKKVKRQASSISFSLSRWFRRLSTSKPSAMTFTVIVVTFAVFLFGGGLFSMVGSSFISSLPSAYINGRFYFLAVPSIGGGLGEQFQVEPIISGALYMIGFV